MMLIVELCSGQPVKSPVSKLPFETIEPGSLRASILEMRPPSASSPEARKPISSEMAISACSTRPPSSSSMRPSAELDAGVDLGLVR